VGLTPVRTLGAAQGYGGGSTETEPFALIVMRLTAAAWANQDAESQARLADMLLLWADQDGLTQIAGDPVNGTYAAGRTILPVLVGYSLIRPALTPDKRARLDGWVKKMVGNLRVPTGPISSRNNHRLLRDSVHMAYGALIGDADELKIGLDSYTRALGEARTDGGLPLELQRGYRAIFYQRHAISSLVTLAEIAAGQGYDLYGTDVRGVTLHTLVTFLLDAIETPSRVLRDAAANVSVPAGTDYRSQDLGFLDPRGHGRHYMAWVVPYIARFPDHANSLRLNQFFTAGRFKHPMIDDYVGGNMSCLRG
jgi:poly(beta-D-mannuronate) lyase